jgi:hypothetical protein
LAISGVFIVKISNFSPGSHPICIDTGASCCISNTKSDFTDLTPITATLSGFAQGLHIQGTGTLNWTLLNDASEEVTISIPNSMYVPSVPMSLLSPQHIAQETKLSHDGFTVHASHGVLTFGGHQRTVLYNPTNNLPIFFTATNLDKPILQPPSAVIPTMVQAYLSSENLPSHDKLSAVQCRLLNKHYQLGHLHMSRIQQLARDGILGKSYSSLSHCDPPLCRACLHGKQHRRVISPTTSTPIDALHLNPGDCVSCDQLESSTPGHVPTFQGSPTTIKHHAGTLFIDHASRYLFFHSHISTGAQEAIHTKLHFQQHCMSYNRTIKCYHTDNGVFRTKPFCSACLHEQQAICYCGVNAHHQNGITERYIRTISVRACTMLIHAIINWPEIIQESYWPYAIHLAVAIHNNTPGASSLTPTEILSGSKHPCRLSDFHPFGCPIFVLDPRLQQGQKIPKWQPRSRLGVYLGPSPHHASNVPLVLSTTTGLVSPQFHVGFDDTFSTISSLHTNKLPDHWPNLFQTSTTSFVDEDYTKTNFYSTNPYSTSFQRESTINTPSSASFQREPANTVPNETSSNMPLAPFPTPIATSTNMPLGANQTSPIETFTQIPLESSVLDTPQQHFSSGLTSSTIPHELPSPAPFFSPPASPASQRESIYDNTTIQTANGWNKNHQYNTRFKKKVTANFSSHPLPIPNHQISSSLQSFLSTTDIAPFSSIHLDLPSVSFVAFNNPDVLHYGAMQKDPDKAHFEADMVREVKDFFDNDCISIVPRSDLPPGHKPLCAIWSFRRKRAPDWSIVKYKSHLCPHGGQQIEGLNFWDTYAPVVSWRTIRLCLVLSLLSNMKTCQLDYVGAFPQADADCEVYMNIPGGFIVKNNTLNFTTTSTINNSKQHLLKIKKNIYDLCQAGNVWFDKLHQGLLLRGFKQSLIDPCLFYRKDCILLLMWMTVSYFLLLTPSSTILSLTFKKTSNSLMKATLVPT